MNETYEWLYDHYALPLMRVESEANQIRQSIVSHGSPDDRVFLEDQIASLCMVWGTDAFTLGLQLGLRLMGERRGGGPAKGDERRRDSGAHWAPLQNAP